MPGILDFLKNPKVQDTALSVAGAAAFGANPILGLLAAPLVMDHREKTRLGLENAREDIESKRLGNEASERAAAAAENLPAVLSPGAPLTESGRRGELIRSAAAMAPGLTGGAIAGQMFPNRRSPTGIMAIAESLMAEDDSLTMTEALAQAAALQGGADPNAALETELLETQREIAGIELANLQRDQETRDNSIRGSAENVFSVADSALKHNLALKGSLLESGSIGSNLPRWAQSGAEIGIGLFQGPEEAAQFRQTIVEMDLFKKDITDFNVQLVTMLENAGVSLSNQFRADLANASASIGIDPDANQSIIFRNLDRGLAAAEQQGIQIPEIRTMQEELLQKYQGDPIDTYLQSLEGYAEASPAEKLELRRLLEAEMGAK